MTKAKTRLTRAKSRLKKGSSARTFIMGFFLGTLTGVMGYLYADNIQLRNLYRTNERPNSCQELSCTEQPVEQSFKIVKQVQASTKAKVTAYSCGGLTTQAEINMNCPSLRYSENGRTANGTEPIPYKTMACDSYNMGKTFTLEGYGEVTCTDTGGAINGAGRFDLYLPTVQEARAFGVQYLEYGS